MAESNPQRKTPGARSRASRWYVIGGISSSALVCCWRSWPPLSCTKHKRQTHASWDRRSQLHLDAGYSLWDSRPHDGPHDGQYLPLYLDRSPECPSSRRVPRGGSYLDPLEIYDRVPPGSLLIHTLPQKGELDVTATFWTIDEAVDDQGYTWYQVYVPVRPSGTKGWVRASDVATKIVTHDVRVHLSGHRLDLYDRGNWFRCNVGVGTDDTPTPPGEYSVSIKAKPPNPGTVYGVLVIGLSAFSEKLTDWPGGGQVGIHGTNDPSSIGTDVSHGCVRFVNEDILELSNDVPLGTPVFVES